MNTFRGLLLVLVFAVALVITGCATTDKTASSEDNPVVAADMSQAKGCAKPCSKSSDAAKAACCAKKKAEGKCPVAAGKKKASDGCSHKKAGKHHSHKKGDKHHSHNKKGCSTDKAKKSSGCQKEKAAKAQPTGCSGK
ncbi:MAG: hypothetical protein ACYTF1_11225 [Planctomycetota bacterium]|jgi:hypothetical protein